MAFIYILIVGAFSQYFYDNLLIKGPQQATESSRNVHSSTLNFPRFSFSNSQIKRLSIILNWVQIWREGFCLFLGHHFWLLVNFRVPSIYNYGNEVCLKTLIQRIIQDLVTSSFPRCFYNPWVSNKYGNKHLWLRTHIINLQDPTHNEEIFSLPLSYMQHHHISSCRTERTLGVWQV